GVELARRGAAVAVQRIAVVALLARVDGAISANLPATDVGRGLSTRGSKGAADVQIRPADCQRRYLPAGATAQRRPGAAVPFRKAIRAHAIGSRELPAGVQIRPVGDQGLDAVVHTGAERRPRAAVPSRDAIDRDAAGGGEASAGIEIGPIDRYGVDLTVRAGTER